MLRTGLFIANEEKRLLGNCVFKAFDGKVKIMLENVVAVGQVLC